MVDRKHIESVLKVNGVPPSAPDEVIRSVLLSARYDKDEVDAAIMILRQNTKTNETRVDGLHKVFRSNDALSAAEISVLLGVDVNLDTITNLRQKQKSHAKVQNIVIIILSILLGVAGLLFYMYVYQVGIFYPDTTVT